MARFHRSEERAAVKQGDVITAVSSHSLNPKTPPKQRQYPRRFWGEDVAAWFDQAQDGDEVAVLVHVTVDSEGFLSLRDRPVLAAAPTPTGVKEALSGSGFVNPYTFVPTLPRADLVAGPGETGLGDSGQAGPPSHSLVSSGEWTGRLRVRLTTLTPLLLPDTERAQLREKQLTVGTRLDADGLPLIPGSSLKGALRSAYETVTASRYGVLGDHDGRLAYRIPATKGIDVVPAVVEDDGAGRRVLRLCRGDRAWNLPSQQKNLLQAAAWVPAYSGQQRHLHLVGGLRGPLSDLHGRDVAARLRLYQYQHPKRPGRFQVWRVTHLAPNLAALDQALTAGSISDPEQPSRSLTLIGNIPARTAEGRLSVTGHSIGTKHDERFFVYSDADHRVPVESRHLEFWQSILDAYTAAKDYNTVPDGLQRSRHVDDAVALRELPVGTPVYVTYEQSGDEVTGVYPVMIGRMPFDRSPAGLLDPSLRPAATAAQLSPADRLFGWVPIRPTADRGDRDHRGGSSGYRGRLAVRSVTCMDTDWKGRLPDGGVVLTALSSPKPTQFRFYAARDQAGTPVRPKVEKDTGYTADAGLRGRKAYRWPKAPDAYWQPPSSTQDFATVSGTARYREYLDPGAPASQTTRYESWVRPGVSFDADLFLDGVPAAELGALLWLLDQGETSPLRLGAGKPLGFGVLACAIDWDTTQLWDGDAVADSWRSLARPAPADADRLRALAAGFQSAAQRHPVLAEALTSYQKATAGITDHPVHYPRPTERPQAESYEWFVQNERSTRDGVTQGWALPHVRDPEPRLPYFSGDGDDRSHPGPRPGQGQRGQGRGQGGQGRPGQNQRRRDDRGPRGGQRNR